MEASTEIRYRVNITRGMQGRISWDATVDVTGLSMEEVLWKSDELTAQLELRYPAIQEGGK
jgi:hypothetical protein